MTGEPSAPDDVVATPEEPAAPGAAEASAVDETPPEETLAEGATPAEETLAAAEAPGEEEPLAQAEPPVAEELATQELPAVKVAELAPEPDYPPPDSVPRPPPPMALKVYGTPRVDELSVAHGSVLGDTKLTITGENLFRATIVRIGGVIAQTIGATEPRELRVLTPQSARAGEVDIALENPFAQPLVMPKAFRYDALLPPKIVSVAPDHVATKGSEVTLTGESFVKATVVLFDGKPAASVRIVSATTIDVKVPPGDDGRMVDVSVKNPDGQVATVRRAFMYDRRYG
ncbi:MAG: IPT/TIG domain-containing protein [Polyangiaceae bacterium]